MRDVTPAKATRRFYGWATPPERSRKIQRLSDVDEPNKLSSNSKTSGTDNSSIRDKVLAGIRMGFAKQKTGESDMAESIRSAVSSPDDPRAVLHGLDIHAPTVAAAQCAVAERLGIKSNQSTQQNLNDIHETNGMSEMVHPGMSAFETDEPKFHNFEHFTFREPHV